MPAKKSVTTYPQGNLIICFEKADYSHERLNELFKEFSEKNSASPYKNLQASDQIDALKETGFMPEGSKIFMHFNAPRTGVSFAEVVTQQCAKNMKQEIYSLEKAEP